MNFIDRADELDALQAAYERLGAELFVLYGRRRLGKTTLLRRFSENRPGAYHVADRAAEPDARRFLAASMARGLGEPTLRQADYPDWYSLFAAYDRFRPSGRSLLILDEYQYLTEVQPAFSSYLQKWWDEHWKDTSLMLVLCGSALSMMYRETLARSSPLYGRRTGQWLLKPLRFRDAAAFFPDLAPREAAAVWSLVGGVPYYAELASGASSFRAALRELVLSRGGPLYSEARFLLQEAVSRPNLYWSLLHAIGSGVSRISELAARLGVAANQLTRYLTALQDLGLVVREVPVTDPNPSRSKKGLYQIDDPFVRLWFGCVSPYESLLEFGRIDQAEKEMSARLLAHQSWAFERICRQHVEDSARSWGAVRVGKYWDRRTEVDVVAVNRRQRVVFAGEAKWGRRPVGIPLLNELKDKVERLWPGSPPRLGLFSAGGFTPALKRRANDESILLVSPDDLL